ncbi:TetR/AcrR family transcriptional regulator [Sphaerisporangium fuscum]|uniref:TetR/AcrR family transcriptional regulator n=1 Tax=Sphaerisporangium fuscum TaxID=2835868 RepID=UPI001BDD7907|nr:TetR/AcrR family transcriptional regulator C-terminal domain-containing protein [Sphaerisporangium fuscum]
MASAEDSPLIWARPEPGTRRPKFTRDQIASTALRIADAEGFAAVSMRRIAAELGAGTMTLYYYVRTKDELVALMDDAIMAEVLIPAEEFPANWYDALTEIALRTWDALVRHPWALHSLQGAQAGPNAMRHFEQSLAALAGTGLDAPGKFALISMVDDFVHGNALRSAEMRSTRESAQDGPAGEDDEAFEAAVRFARAQMATGELPHTQALFGDEDPRTAFPRLVGDLPERDRFRQGLSILLDGAATRMNLTPPAH